MTAEWNPSSWRERPAQQQPVWPDESATDAVLRTEVEKRATRGLDRLGKDGGMTPNRLVNPQPERLNFDQLEMLGERMKKLNK